MARNISSRTVQGASFSEDIDRVCTGIFIELDPRKPMSMQLHYADVVERTTTVEGQTPEKEVVSVNYAGQLDVSKAEMQALPCFADVYAQLKSLSDSKSAAQWPNLAAE